MPAKCRYRAGLRIRAAAWGAVFAVFDWLADRAERLSFWAMARADHAATRQYHLADREAFYREQEEQAHQAYQPWDFDKPTEYEAWLERVRDELGYGKKIR
jgi:hypothetical protein